MAAVTVASKKLARYGRQRVVTAAITSPDDADTWDTGLSSIDSVSIDFPGGDLAAADAVSYTASGGTVTFNVIGTARDLVATARGV